MKKSFIIFGFLFIILFLIVIIINNYSFSDNVLFYKCVDGDTAWFLINGKKEKVRFLGINTPESVHSNGIIEDYGLDASNYTCDLLKNADTIYLEYDNNSDRYDKYDRLLAWVFVDNNNLSELLVKKGLAKVDYIYGDYKYVDNLCKYQKNAYSEQVGIWKNSNNYSNNYCNR